MPTMRRGNGLGPKIRIDPPHLVIERLAVRKDPLREALADDHDRFVCRGDRPA